MINAEKHPDWPQAINNPVPDANSQTHSQLFQLTATEKESDSDSNSNEKPTPSKKRKFKDTKGTPSKAKKDKEKEKEVESKKQVGGKSGKLKKNN